MLRRLIAFGVLAGAATLAQAKGWNEGGPAHKHSGFELGAGMGLNQVQVEDIDGAEFFNEHATAWRVFGGYRLNRYVGLEVGWIDGGSVGKSFGSAEYRVETKALQGSVLGMLPIGDRVQLFARASEFKWKLKERLQDRTTRLTAETKGNEFGWGAGVGLLFDGALLRFEYEQADFDAGVSTKLISASMAWNF